MSAEEEKVMVEGMPGTPLVVPEPEDPTQLAREKAIQDNYLGKTIRIKLHDGRIYQGTMDCFDNHANVILDNVSSVENGSVTLLPTPVPVLVGWKHIDSIEVRKEHQ